MSSPIDGWLAANARRRDDDGVHRSLQPRESATAEIDVAGNDYLGLSRHPDVIEAAVTAAREWGAGATGSRLVSGTTRGHADLEDSLACFLEAPAGLVFSSGYTANLGVIAALGGRDALVVSDQANHASIVDACRLSRSRVTVTPHHDLAAVERALSVRAEPRALVVIDAVFSVDGDLAPVADLHAICRAHGAVLVVDEAHALGVVGSRGQGVCVEAGVATEPDVVRTVTLSKALGSQGGAVLATQAVVDHLINSARTLIFDTGLAPACVGAADAALRILDAQPRLVAKVRETSQRLALGLGVETPAAAVVSLVLGDPGTAYRVAAACRADGVHVGCFRPPTVPAGQSRLRLTARADLTTEEVDRAVTAVLTATKELQ
jgi:8-amino-7-oxononanoate synthase